MKTLLLGMGNPILGDDVVGIRLAAELARSLGHLPDLDVIEECSVGGLNLLDHLVGYDRVIVFDSIRTCDGSPGSWYRFDADALQGTLHLSNIHDTNFATALELGRRLGLPLPPSREIIIFAVEVAEVSTFSEQMTPALQQAWPAMKTAILRSVRALLTTPGPA